MPQDIDILDPVPNPLTQDMRARTKAAIVVRFLMQEGAEIDLALLPTSLQADLTREIADLPLIDRATLAEVIEEFAHELDSVGLTAQGGLGSALRLLEGKITHDTARRLRQDAGVRLFEDPWGRIKQLDEQELLKLLESETKEISAVVLSKLDVKKAAAVLGGMPGDRARKISFAISQTARVTPDAVDRIAAILTAASDDLRDKVMNGLRETDPELAERVLAGVFTFIDIPTRIAIADVAMAVKTVAQTDLVVALCYANSNGMEEVSDFILEGLSRRMAETLREEIAERGAVKTKDGDAAITALVSGVQGQISAGEISFVDLEQD
jgi:flagellar motor switch protein FliG